MKIWLQFAYSNVLSLCLCLTIAAANADEKQAPANDPSSSCPNFLNHNYRLLHHTKEINLCDLKADSAILIINTASHCGFTPQFKGLEALSQKYKDAGLVVVGFASDDFNQETKDEAESAGICYINFGVTFTMLAPTHVRGENANPSFQYLNKQAGKPSWNFNKYLVDLKSGDVRRFGSKTKPLDSNLEHDIQALLGPISSIEPDNI